MYNSTPALRDNVALRQVQARWNPAMVVASVAVSFLGAFTSIQLMCHARAAYQFSSVCLWALLGSLTFGFCSIWSLHEVAMLAYEFDLNIGVDPRLTVLSAILAVTFTFTATAGDLLYDRYTSRRHGRTRQRYKQSRGRRIAREHLQGTDSDRRQSTMPLLSRADSEQDTNSACQVALPFSSTPSFEHYAHDNDDLAAFARPSLSILPSFSTATSKPSDSWPPDHETDADSELESRDRDDSRAPSNHTASSDYLFSRRHSNADSSSGSFGLRTAVGFMAREATLPAKNVFFATAKLLYQGITTRNILIAFVWSLAITSMHYSGIASLEIPHGHYTLNPGLAILSALISWLVCAVAVILMSKIETHLALQVLFSVIAAAGVAAMHFVGMAATTFWSIEPASKVRGFPNMLGGSVVAVAFITCILANVLLSHSATISRNKLAEIMWTRKELFKNIALKEHAEAAARTRSEFIALASHEIRTPLHHLQGYSDLLAQTELTLEGRSLMAAIQRATKTLSLLTNNVLDWSKFEGISHGEYRPTAVDIRTVCESVVTLVPNIGDEDATVDIYVVVSPDVPKKISIDESWASRILMNLLSNAIKFTKNGYILLSLFMREENLVAVVRDTGCGLDPNFIQDMWTPFKQGEVRGSARGTGLGLSIVRQLVTRMNGSIEVESKYEQTDGVGSCHCGTTFTITIPLETSQISPSTDNPDKPKVAVLSHQDRAAQGLRLAWEYFGAQVHSLNTVEELGDTHWKYVWVDPSFLTKTALSQLLCRSNLLILVPYVTHDALDSFQGLLQAPNVVFLQKPLQWHRFTHRILTARERRAVAAPSQALRFAPEVQILNADTSMDSKSALVSRQYTILLVEDNLINRKLGAKMLASLNYHIIWAVDGEDALAVLSQHDDTIDCILMDQSMPKMDGITATTNIRQREREGLLRRNRPIIAVTAVVNSQSKEKFREAGADDFLAKPLSLDRLRDILDLYLPPG